MENNEKLEDFIARLKERPREQNSDLLKARIYQKVSDHETRALSHVSFLPGLLRPVFALGACCLLACGAYIFLHTQRLPAHEPAAAAPDTSFQGALYASFDSSSLNRVYKILDASKHVELLHDSITTCIVQMLDNACQPSTIADSAETIFSRFHASRTEFHEFPERIERRIETKHTAKTLAADSVPNSQISKEPSLQPAAKERMEIPAYSKDPDRKIQAKEDQMQQKEDKMEKRMERKKHDRKNKM